MKVFAISDLHLSGLKEKPMNIFGEVWEGHFEKIIADCILLEQLFTRLRELDPEADTNIKADKEKSTEKIDGDVATIMALDRAIRCGNDTGASVYDSRGLLFI